MLRLIKLICVLVLSIPLSGCGVFIVGGMVGGATILADRRTPAVQAIDLGIEIEANSQLSRKFGESAHIVVVSFNQKVLLIGEAKDEAIKGQAATDVKAMKNVRSLFNEIIIGPNSSLGARASDSYLASSIKTQLIFTPDIPSNSMNISVEGGRVYLMGILTQQEADKAKQIVSKVSGVKQVFAFFDIISEAEKQRLEKEGKARTSQPDNNPAIN
jgi:osmotically-inducible protein OsmY